MVGLAPSVSLTVPLQTETKKNPHGPVMSPKSSHHWTFCLLLLVTTTFLPLICEGTEYDEFLRRHVDYPKSDFGNDNDYCKEMMHIRGMLCWRSNTFLHINDYDLQTLCSSSGYLVAEMRSSPIPFSVTICSRKGRKAHTSCTYKGKSIVKKIWVTCVKGLPIHLNKYG
ncbi:ribonuclease-like [Eublepharis macularius]|uniref:Ribonuclease-like n=1 Tax=Eublepharis macularius TaxID=481883 RepID=A0AA97LBZ1_EUBMA|nr:ribonuclease-like [Eublepharis macularius]